MIAPSALVILSPPVAGLVFERNCCAGLLLGALVSKVQLAFSISTKKVVWTSTR